MLLVDDENIVKCDQARRENDKRYLKLHIENSLKKLIEFNIFTVFLCLTFQCGLALGDVRVCLWCVHSDLAVTSLTQRTDQTNVERWMYTPKKCALASTNTFERNEQLVEPHSRSISTLHIHYTDAHTQSNTQIMLAFIYAVSQPKAQEYSELRRRWQSYIGS